MEKKDWKKKLRELSFMKGYYFKLEDNGLVEKKDDQLVFNREELERFVQQELDKAREEGFRIMFEGLDNIARNSSEDFYEGVAIIKLRNEITRLSKLKTKEDGK